MHLIRRAAFRAASSSPSTSLRSISTSSPFVLRSSKTQSAIAPSVFKRFNSDDTSREKSSVESTEGEKGSVRSAIDSAFESASTYASEAKEKVSESIGQAREAASTVGEYARREYAPRDQGERRPYGGDRGGRGGYGGDRGPRGGYGGSRGGRDMDRGGFGREELKLTPTPSIYVGNLLFDCTTADLEREFGQFGNITSTVIATDPRGLSKGFAYVHFETIQQAAAAIEAKHQTVLDGRRLVVNYMARTIREHKENEPSKTLFIGNLAFEMSDADLNKLFRDIRNVIDVRVAIDRRTGQPRGFAHADFVTTEDATKGKEALQGKEVYGRVLRVDYSAAKREDRGGSGSPRGAGF